MRKQQPKAAPSRRVKKSEAGPTPKVREIKPVTKNHEDYIRSIVENDVTICMGPSGTGKSYICAGLAAQWLHAGRYDQVIVTRPLVNAGQNIGALPGEMKDKIAPYLMPMQENFAFFLGQAFFGHYFNNKQIRFEPLETMRGATFNNSILILDESQNCTPEQIKLFITRIGKGSKVIINGDAKQTDIFKKSGLLDVSRKLRDIDGIGVVQMDRSDIQRNGIIGRILAALED